MNGGGSPVWLTVIVARIAGGFAAGFVAVATFAHVSTTSDVTTTPSQVSPWFAFGPTAIGALTTGFALSLLMPRMSGRAVSIFQAIVAAAAGSLFTLVVTLLFSHGISVHGATSSLMLLSSGTMAVSLFGWIFAVMITTWMVTNASQPLDGRWGGKQITSQHSWSDKPSTGFGDADIERRQAERGYWGGMEDPRPDEPNRDN
jgi:ABC-type bacteriocin/lantibiotic exporter with double-glycine peptidase domain